MSNTNGAGLINLDVGDGRVLEPAAEARHAIQASRPSRNLFRAVCLQRRPDSAQGAPLSQ